MYSFVSSISLRKQNSLIAIMSKTNDSTAVANFSLLSKTTRLLALNRRIRNGFLSHLPVIIVFPFGNFHRHSSDHVSFRSSIFVVDVQFVVSSFNVSSKFFSRAGTVLFQGVKLFLLWRLLR